jgi:tripartite-type tricarboxylate transporter receptor subunit TctC
MEAPTPAFAISKEQDMRQIVKLLAGAAALFCCLAAQAQPFPSKPIRLLVPVPPGGSPDVLARTVAQKMSESLGQQVIVDNRTGAGGIVAATAVINSAPDGYTLIMVDSALYAVLPHMSQNVSFDPLKDLAPVALVATSPLFLVVNPGLNVNTVKEFVAFAKARQGLAYASGGNGSIQHLAMEMLKSLAGLELTHVPFKGAAQALPAVMSGDVVAAFAGLNLAQAQARAGKVRMLGIATERRSALAPEVPTIAEAGVPGFGMSISLGFLAPSKTPREVILRLNDELMKAVNAPEVKQRLFAMGVEASPPTSPEYYAEAMLSENQQYGKLVRASSARVD